MLEKDHVRCWWKIDSGGGGVAGGGSRKTGLGVILTSKCKRSTGT